jgi:monovalent cation:proton antiporter-2 (CPA2) family protein
MNNLPLLSIFIFLAAACIVVPLASRFKLSSVLGYLGTGIIIGPWCLGFINEPEKIMHLAEFGVIMMLFVIGLELEPAVLWRLRTAIIGLGGLQVTLTSAAFTGIGMWLGLEWQTSLAIGMALSLSSTALVLQMLHEKNLMNTIIGEISFSVLLFQDIAVIPILIIMPLLALHGAHTNPAESVAIASWPAYLQAMTVAGVITSMILAGRYLSPFLFKIIAKTNIREIFTAFSLALIIGITLLMQLVGVSPALGAFIAGVVLANSEYRRSLETDIAPFKGLLLGLFFISVGMEIDFGLIASQPLQIISTVAGLMAIKASILWILGRHFGLTPLHNIGYALALSQGGEFAFVLFQFAGGLAILQPEQVKFFMLVVALSIGITPLVMMIYSRFVVKKFISTLPERSYDLIHHQHPIILAGFGRFGQIIGRFLTGQGIKVTILEKDPDQIALLRKFDFKGHFGDATRLDVLRSAGIDKAKLLIVAVDEIESSLEIVRMVKEEYPEVTIFSRARNRKHAHLLHKLGVHYFKRELFDSSLDMAKEIMVWLGKPVDEMTHKAAKFRQHDEATLRASFVYYEDEAALVNFARTRSAELERILQSDFSDREKIGA